MQNYFILAIAVSVIYILLSFGAKRIQGRSNEDVTEMKKTTMRDIILLFISVCISLFGLEMVGVMRLANLKTVVSTPAFTTGPDF